MNDSTVAYLEGILVEVVERYTPEIYQEGERFKAILDDLMRKEPKLLKLLKLMIDQKVASSLYALCSKTEQEFDMGRRKLITDMADTFFSEEASMEIGVNLLCTGLGKSVEVVFGRVKEPVAPSTPTPPAPPVTPVTPVTPRAVIDPLADTTGWTDKGKELLQKALAGDARAQINLGYAYEKGEEGLKVDVNLAFYWYEKSANGGNATGQRNLGFFYQKGRGTVVDYQKAIYWYEKAAQGGNDSAKNDLGFCYESGLGVAKNLEKAFYWYEQAAQGGNSSAQRNVALFYKNGSGVEKDLDKAFYWFEKAVQSGNPRAQTDVALAYIYGAGVAMDKETGRLLLKKSVDAGEQRAIDQYKRIFGSV